MKSENFFDKFKSIYLWGNLLAMLLVVIIVVLVVQLALRSCTHHGEKIIVPDLRGITVEQATRALQTLNLHIEVSDTTYEDDQARGTIVRQTPAGGHAVKEDRCIYVTVNSMAARLREIPDLVDNKTYQEARLILQSMGFKLTEPRLIDGEEDWVYDLKWQGRSIRSGDKVPQGSKLTLVIGNGHIDDYVDEEEEVLDENGSNEVADIE